MDKQVTRCGRHIIKDDITLLRDARRRVIGYVYMSFHGSDVYVKESLRFSCLYYIIQRINVLYKCDTPYIRKESSKQANAVISSQTLHFLERPYWTILILTFTVATFKRTLFAAPFCNVI